MSIRFFRLIVAGMVRRRKQIFRVSLAVFLSFVFITGILLFQENMYNWQRASSKEHFGDWFVMRVQSAGQDKPAVAEHAYLDGGVTAQTASHVYDSAWGKTDYYIGTMSDDFIRQGNISVDQGKMPKNDDEIARFQILIRTGAQRSTIVGICMVESVRESLWCIGIAPVTLLIHYLIYHRYVRRM